MPIPTLHLSATATEAARNLAKTLARETLNGTRDVLLLLSGGSTLAMLEYLPTIDDTSFLTISVIDERDDPSGETSNFHALKQLPWFSEVIALGASFIDPLHPTDTTKKSKAESFEQTLRKWKASHGDGIVTVVLGMGPDGHTMGVFPLKNKSLFQTRFLEDAWAVANTVPDAPFFPVRITATLTFLQKETDAVYCYICGKAKQAVLRKALDGEVPIHELPMSIITTIPNTHVFTDIHF